MTLLEFPWTFQVFTRDCTNSESVKIITSITYCILGSSYRSYCIMFVIVILLTLFVFSFITLLEASTLANGEIDDIEVACSNQRGQQLD